MVFRKKEPTSQRIYNFSFKILKVKLIVKSLKMFKNNMKFTRAACWINLKISNRDKNTTLIIFLLLRCKFLKLEPSEKKVFLFALMRTNKNDKKCFLFHLKSSPHSQDNEIFVLTFWACKKLFYYKGKQGSHSLENHEKSSFFSQCLENPGIIFWEA